MGFDSMKERRQVEKEIEEKKQDLQKKQQHDDWLADSVFPTLYAQVARKNRIDEKLVVFASAKKEKLPVTMQSLFRKLTEKGYTCRFFGVPETFKNRKKN